MSKYFDSDKNPVAGIFLSYMLTENEELLDNENILYLYGEISDYLKVTVKNVKDIDYLNFDVKSDKEVDYVEIKPANLTTALWFCGIFPSDCKQVEEDGSYKYLGQKYSLNMKTKKLKIVKL